MISKRHARLCETLAVLALILVLAAAPAAAANPMKASGTSKKAKASEASADTIALPEKLTPEKVDSLIAAMSDQQVRRLLIDQLKSEAQREAESAAPKGPTGLAGFINRTKEMVTFLQARGKLG